MKKFICAALFATVVGTFAIAGCGSSKDVSEATTEASEQEADIEEVVPVEVNASEFIELGEYKGLTIEGTKAEVSEEDIDAEIEQLRYDYSEFKEVKGRDTVEAEDTVNIDFICKVDGKELDAYSAEDYDLSIGSGDLVLGDNFDVEKALVGAKVGEKVTVKGTFFTDEMEEEIAGKEGEMIVTINHISEEVLPEIDDAFIKENCGFDTLEKYRKHLAKELKEQAEDEATQENDDLLWDQIMKNAKQIKEFPEDIIALEKQNVIIQEKSWTSSFGMDITEDVDGYFQETYQMSLDEYTKDTLLRQCILDLIIEKEQVKATEEEIKEVVKEEMEYGGYESEDEVFEYYPKENIENEVVYEKVMDIIRKSAIIK